MSTDAQIKAILENPFDRKWSIQGLGMLRTYLDDGGVERLHIWDADQAVEDVSSIHDHPWDFESRVIRGEIRNQRYVLTPLADGKSEADVSPYSVYQTARIRCGEGGGLISAASPVLVGLTNQLEVYLPGQSYSMEAPELHESFPSAGAVTVIKRKFHAERDIATVCWRDGDWVSAEPRPATRAEIGHFIDLARIAASA